MTLEFTGHDSPVRAIAFAPDAKQVASIGQEPHKGSLFVWNSSSGDIIFRQYAGHWSSVTFAPDGQHLATAELCTGEATEEYPAARIWHLGTGKEVRSLKGHQNAISQVSFSPDGKQLVSASWDQTVRLWDIEAGEEAVTFHEEATALCATFSADGLRLASGSADHTVKLWSRAGNASRVLNMVQKRCNNIEFGPDSQRIVSARGGEFDIWDAIRGKKITTVGNIDSSPNGRATWSPCGKLLAVGRKVWPLEPAAAVRVMELQRFSGPRIDSATAGIGTAFSPDGKLLAAVVNREEVCVWDAVTGKLLRVLTKVPTWALCVAFAADNQRVAIGSGTDRDPSGRTVQIWDLATGQVSFTMEGYFQSVYWVAYSRDGKWLAAAGGCHKYRQSSPGQVLVWDATTGQLRYSLRGHSWPVWSLSFSSDGKRLASASSKEVKVWDMQTGQEVCTLREPTGDLHGVSFSPDGRRLAAGGLGFVKIWDGTPLAQTPEWQTQPVDP
jgi:WD40 repeat protein